MNDQHFQTELANAAKLQAEHRFKEASQVYADLFARQPSNPTLFLNFGFCCQESGELELAEKAYLRARNLGVDSAVLRFNLGIVLFKLGRLHEAVTELLDALRLDPGLSHACLALGNIYRQNGDRVAAMHWLEREIKNNPNCAEAYVNLGALLQETHQLQQAIHCYREALRILPAHPILHFNLGIAALMAEDFDTGWAEYEWRWQARQQLRPASGGSAWTGQVLAGRKLLIFCEQGIGDTLMFIRYIPWIPQKNAHLVLKCQRGLRRLIQSLPWPVHVIEEGEQLPNCDFEVPLLSLPHVLGPPASRCQDWKPYLRVPKGGPPLPPHDRKKLKVGLVWAGNPQNPNDRNRSIPFGKLAPLLRHHSRVQFFSLQLGAEATQVHKNSAHIIDLAPLLTDFAATASLLAQLDLTVTVDTAVAHLAGALGLRAWVMLPFAGDWRWGLAGTVSYWYSTMRLFRQPAQNDWSSVIAQIDSELNALTPDPR